MTDLPKPIENLPEKAEEMANQAKNQVERLPQQAENASAQVAEQIESVKSKITQPLPTPPEMSKLQAPPEELLKRLNWGEPALTIIDVRSRAAFNEERITGAVPIPADQILQGVESSLEYARDIYLYGDSNEAAAEAASQLRQAGYINVALVKGGLPAWKSIGGSTEGSKAFASPARS
jgi:rhodanese-related sulfurtransferase